MRIMALSLHLHGYGIEKAVKPGGPPHSESGGGAEPALPRLEVYPR